LNGKSIKIENKSEQNPSKRQQGEQINKEKNLMRQSGA
jgi:hypothetical protein